MQIIDTIQQEIASIDDAQKRMAQSKTALRNFILSLNFLILHRIFDQLLSIWADTLISLVEATGTAFAGEAKLPQENKPLNLGEETITQVEGSDLTLAKALVLIIVNIGVVAVTIQMQGPIVIPVVVASFSVGLCFFQQIASFIRDLLKKEEEKAPPLDALTSKVSESISYMRNEYVKRRFLIKFQKSSPQMKAHRSPYVDPALVDRELQTMEEMPSAFLSRIDDISVECNNAAFRRKMVLYSYLRNYQPQPMQVPPA